MEFDYEFLINKYGQSLIDIDPILAIFEAFDLVSKRNFLSEIIFLIDQSKPNVIDIVPAISSSGLKPTYTPCVLLKKGVENHHIQKLLKLPQLELKNVLILLLSLFKIAYMRRYELEKNNQDKWWYWDLSKTLNVNKIMQKYK